MAIPKETKVLIIGGGPNGLVASGLLSQLGIANVVVERRAGTQKAPAAHVIRQRPLEVLVQLGLEDEIRRATPDLPMNYINWVSTLGGAEVGRLDLRPPRGEPNGKPADSTESTWINLSQNKLEPILASAAFRAPEAELVFGAECVDVSQDDEGVDARLRLEDGTEQSIRASWAIAADGAGSRTREGLGIDMAGSGPLGFGPLGKFFMIHFRAELGPWVAERSGPLFWVLNPSASGVLVVHDPGQSYVYMTPALGLDDEESSIPDRLAAAMDVPVDLEILSVDTWVPFNQVAERYREGRVFLVGDAAHRFPPSGGLGLNTGILDVQNLVWKLALVDSGAAGDRLLDRYEEECRPAALTNADESFGNMISMSQVTNAIGEFSDLNQLVERLGSMNTEERRTLQESIDAQRSHFASTGAYPAPLREEGELAIMRWPSSYEGFTLFAESGDPWAELARELSARKKIRIDFQELRDGEAASLPVSTSAFLTRPDGVIEWVESKSESDPMGSLLARLDQVLCC